MVDFNYEIRYVETMLPELDKYLHSRELYRMVFIAKEASEPPYPTLTVGTYLFALQRAQGYASSTAELSQLRKLIQETNRLRMRWRQAWLEKTKLESSSRIRRWEDFLREYLQKPADQIDRYAYEVRNRVILELLKGENPELTNIWDLLNQLDHLLQERWIKGNFIWESDLAPHFPIEPYWYLWGKPC